MTRFNEIKNYALQAEFYHATPIDAFIRGALWADRNPDKRKIYTKQELKDMGFSFNLDGDIIIPTKSNKTTEKSNKTTEKSYKLNTIEDSVNYPVRFYPGTIYEIGDENAYTGMKKLPKIIHCNYDSFKFETEWLDIDFKSYFENLKHKSIDIKTKTIKNVETSLNKYKEELESLKKLTYETLDS